MSLASLTPFGAANGDFPGQLKPIVVSIYDGKSATEDEGAGKSEAGGSSGSSDAGGKVAPNSAPGTPATPSAFLTPRRFGRTDEN